MYKGKDGFKIYPHARSKKKLKAKLKTMTNKKRPGTFQEIYADIRRVIIGWMNELLWHSRNEDMGKSYG
ncbi:MAG: hypothetical protein PUJ06_04165 [Stecheria intestinalis]|nr:hypothetical protein [Stecheria intestinalis]